MVFHEEHRPTFREEIRHDRKKLALVILVPIITLILVAIVIAAVVYVALEGKKEQDEELKKTNRGNPQLVERQLHFAPVEKRGKTPLPIPEGKIPLWANFTEAEAYCNSISKRLVVVDSDIIEKSLLKKQLSKDEKEHCAEGYWIGARRNRKYEWYLGDAEMEVPNDYIPVMSSLLKRSEGDAYTGCLQFSFEESLLEPTQCNTKARCFICHNTTCGDNGEVSESCFTVSYKKRPASTSFEPLSLELFDIPEAWKACADKNLSLAKIANVEALNSLREMLNRSQPKECVTESLNMSPKYIVGGQHRHYLESIKETPINYEMKRFNLHTTSTNHYCYKMSVMETFKFFSSDDCTKRLCYICQGMTGTSFKEGEMALNSFQKQMTPVYLTDRGGITG